MEEPETLSNIDQLRKGFQLGIWLVLPDQGLIQEGSAEAHLEPKVMDVLVYLAAHQGEVIKRDKLIDDVWNTYVSDEVLSRAISLLRNALNDDPKVPVYIQTVPKVGYRLIHEVSPTQSQETKRSSLKKPAWIAITVIVLLVAAADRWYGGKSNDTDSLTFPDWLDSLDAQFLGDDEVISIAILPFDNLTEDESNAYLSDGITDEITMSLSRVPGLRVVARRSSYSLKNSAEDIPGIGRLLNVDAVLEGSMRREKERLVINAQLSNVSDGYLMWTQSYERPLERAFSLQGEIATEVVTALQQSSEGAGLSTLQPEADSQPDMKAYQLYLNGRFLSKLRGEHALRKSIQLFREAIEIDPGFLRARLALANSLVLLPFYSTEPTEEMFSEAMMEVGAVDLSNAVDRSDAEAIQAFIAMHRWQFVEAEAHYRQALSLSPDNPNTYVWYSQLLAMVGRNRDAVTAVERAKKLDEVSPVVNDRLAVVYLWVNENDHAYEQFEIGSKLGFSNRINPGYMVFLLRAQRYYEFKAVIKAFHVDPLTAPLWLIESGHLVFLEENREMAIALSAEAEKAGQSIAPALELGLHILIGDVDQAFEKFATLEGTADRKYIYPELLFSIEATEFRQDPRFKQLTKDIGLDDYWALYGLPDDRVE